MRRPQSMESRFVLRGQPRTTTPYCFSNTIFRSVSPMGLVTCRWMVSVLPSAASDQRSFSVTSAPLNCALPAIANSSPVEYFISAVTSPICPLWVKESFRSGSSCVILPVRGALQSLRGSKLRSFLTLLGIILATTTLIAVMSVISGMDVYIAQNVSSMGADGYRVQRIVMMGFDPKKYMEMLRRNPQLTREEYEFLRQRLTMTKEIGINAGRSVTVHRGTELSEDVNLQGASPNIGVINNIEAEEGRFLSETENDRHLNVELV